MMSSRSSSRRSSMKLSSRREVSWPLALLYTSLTESWCPADSPLKHGEETSAPQLPTDSIANLTPTIVMCRVPHVKQGLAHSPIPSLGFPSAAGLPLGQLPLPPSAVSGASPGQRLLSFSRGHSAPEATQLPRPLSSRGHSAPEATQLPRPLSSRGHSAPKATQLPGPLSSQGHSAPRATQLPRPRSSQGHVAPKAAQLPGPLSSRGHSAPEATRLPGPLGSQDHSAPKATQLPRPLSSRGRAGRSAERISSADGFAESGTRVLYSSVAAVNLAFSSHIFLHRGSFLSSFCHQNKRRMELFVKLQGFEMKEK
nr:uncharacterized protein LOC115126309 [Oncorhynchus nerka]